MKTALFLLLVAGCSKELSDLGKYPCAADGQCPNGLACVMSRCQPAELDGACTDGKYTTNCAAAGGNASCWHGLCETNCTSGDGGASSCPSGRTCAGRACLINCTGGAACPAGLGCHPRSDGTTSVCLPAALFNPLDGPCTNDCSIVGGDNASCWKGICEISCLNGSCPTGRVCAGNACLLDCTANGKCPSGIGTDRVGLACHVLGDGVTSACMPPTVYIPACASYTATPAFNCSACGDGTPTVACPDGTQCKVNSSCLPGNQCQCSPGFTSYSCSGQECSQPGMCPWPNWHCVPNTPLNADCNSQDFGSGTCVCRNGRNIARSCSSTSCEALCGSN